MVAQALEVYAGGIKQMTNSPKVAVVILNWNNLNYLKQFLPTVLASTYRNLEVVVGDNGSTDGSVAYLQENFPTVRVIANGENYGFTGGYNRILEKVGADYLVLLNSDIEVPAGWIEPVISMMESDGQVAVAVPKIKAYHQKDHFEHAGAAGGFIDKYGYPFCRGRIFYDVEADRGQYNQSSEIFWASGAALFIRKTIWDASGGFDEKFFAHMEEIDLCWRVKNMGYKVMYCAESEVYHVGGGTLNKENPFKTYLNFRNNLWLLKKNMPAGRAAWVLSLRMWLDLLALLRFLGEGKRRDAWAVSRAHQAFVASLFKSDRQNKARATLKKANLKGMYKGSIVADFFINKKMHFTELDPQDFV